jgi:hypothetical protein
MRLSDSFLGSLNLEVMRWSPPRRDAYRGGRQRVSGRPPTLPFNRSSSSLARFILTSSPIHSVSRFYLMFIWFFIIPSYLSLNSFLLVIAPRAPSRRGEKEKKTCPQPTAPCLSKKFEQICQRSHEERAPRTIDRRHGEAH